MILRAAMILVIRMACIVSVYVITGTSDPLHQSQISETFGWPKRFSLDTGGEMELQVVWPDGNVAFLTFNKKQNSAVVDRISRFSVIK